jgi:microcystin-dependent protein
MSSPFVAEIKIFAGNFAPTGWALCNGQLLPISQNTALFSLLGTFYGGDGKSTFALPDMQGSAPMHQGQGPGLSERFLGETGGSQSVTLLQSEMPVHTHSLSCASGNGSLNTPVANTWAQASILRVGQPVYKASQNGAFMHVQATAIAGSSFPHNNMHPYLALTFIIAMQGVFPPRS